MNFVPYGDKILIKLDPKKGEYDDKTAAGIIKIKTGGTFADLVWGKVVAVSDGYETSHGRVKIRLAPGDRVAYQSGQAVELEFLEGHALLSDVAVVLVEQHWISEKLLKDKDIDPQIKTDMERTRKELEKELSEKQKDVSQETRFGDGGTFA